MTEAAREVLELALRLSAEERARVAQALFDSLEDLPSHAVEAAWRDEVRRRLDDVIRAGKAFGSWDESLARAERRLLERRRSESE